MPYRLSALAERDLNEIWLYVADDASPEIADRLVDDIIERFDLLAEQAVMGRVRSEFGPGVRSFAVENYVIYYRQESDTSDRQDSPWPTRPDRGLVGVKLRFSSESQPSPQFGEIRLEVRRSLFRRARKVAEERLQSLAPLRRLRRLAGRPVPERWHFRIDPRIPVPLHQFSFERLNFWGAFRFA